MNAKMPEPVIPDDIPRERQPDLLRNWHLGSKARRHLSRRRFSAVTGLVSGEGGGRVLDVGCGWGYNLFLLYERGFDPYGVDIVQNDFYTAIRVAEANNCRFGLVGADAGRLPFAERSFCAVTAVETLEHVYAPDRRLAISEIARVLSSGGTLSLSTPNYHSVVETGKRLLVRLPFLKRLFPRMCYPVGDIDRSDYHPYSYHRPVPAGELTALLEEAGFEVTVFRRILFVWKNTPDPLFPLCSLAESMLERFPLIRNLGSTLVVLARRRS